MSESYKSHKLVADKGSHFIVQNSKGEHFPVAKNGLDPLTIQKISKLSPAKPEKMAKGGMVKKYSGEDGDPGAQEVVSDANPAPVDNGTMVADNKNYDPKIPNVMDALNNSLSLTHPNDPSQPGLKDVWSAIDNKLSLTHPKGADPVAAAAQNSAPPPEPPATTPPVVPEDQYSAPKQPDTPAASAQMFGKDYAGQLQNIYNLESKGIIDEAKAKAIQGNALSNANEEYVNQQRGALQDFQDKSAKIMADRDALTKDIQANPVNANKYWQNADGSTNTGKKILSMLGVAISGAGSHWTGGRNLALDNINRNIDADIQAQKANLGTKESLLSRNIDTYKNMQEAMAHTRSQLEAIAQGQIGMANASAMGPMAEANKNQLLGSLKAQMLQRDIELAKYGSQLNIQRGQGTESDLAIAPADVQARAVKIPAPAGLGGQKIALAASPKDAEEIRDKIAKKSSIFQGLSRLEQLGPKAAIPGTAENQVAQSVIPAMQFQLAHDQDIQRLNPNLLKMFSDQFGDPTKWTRFIGIDPKTKSSAFRQTLEDSLMGDLKAKLINYKAPYQNPKVK